MSDYGYLNHSSNRNRDDEAIIAMFNVLPCESVTVEQMWSRNDRSRPAFESLLNRIGAGDTLYVYSVDRLGADVTDVVRVWRTVTCDKRADIVVLNDPRLNSRTNPRLALPQVGYAAQRAFDNLSFMSDGFFGSRTDFQLA